MLLNDVLSSDLPIHFFRIFEFKLKMTIEDEKQQLIFTPEKVVNSINTNIEKKSNVSGTNCKSTFLKST